MPLNESTARRPAMTPQQQREAEIAIFGRPSATEETNERPQNKIQTIDINKPPIRCVLPDGTESDVYRYQEYPRMLFYDGDAAQFIVVQNASQLQIALSRGYTAEIAAAEPEPEPEAVAGPQEHDDEAFERYLAAQPLESPLTAPLKKKR